MSFQFENYGDNDLACLLGGPARAPQIGLGKDPAVDYADDGREITAHFLGFRRRQEASYVLYAYHYKDAEYGFLWETSFDEADRAKNGGEPHIWYDDIREGDTFRVRIRLKDPRQHVIMDLPFTGMNDSSVIFLGEAGQTMKGR
jgi:hypothetical protein